MSDIQQQLNDQARELGAETPATQYWEAMHSKALRVLEGQNAQLAAVTRERDALRKVAAAARSFRQSLRDQKTPPNIGVMAAAKRASMIEALDELDALAGAQE